MLVRFSMDSGQKNNPALFSEQALNPAGFVRFYLQNMIFKIRKKENGKQNLTRKTTWKSKKMDKTTLELHTTKYVLFMEYMVGIGDKAGFF